MPSPMASLSAFERMTVWVIVVVLAPISLSAQKVPLDKSLSSVTVRVYKAGLFSALAHDHVIQAPIASGEISVDNNSVELAFNTAEMKVLDPGVGESERKEIEDTMKSDKVLDVTRFSSVNFTGTSSTSDSSGHRQLSGTLTLHGTVRRIAFPVVFRDGKYTGSVSLKQTDFGITPIKIGGGAVRVKDEIVIEFSVASTSSPGSAR